MHVDVQTLLLSYRILEFVIFFLRFGHDSVRHLRHENTLGETDTDAPFPGHFVPFAREFGRFRNVQAFTNGYALRDLPNFLEYQELSGEEFDHKISIREQYTFFLELHVMQDVLLPVRFIWANILARRYIHFRHWNDCFCHSGYCIYSSFW